MTDIFWGNNTNTQTNPITGLPRVNNQLSPNNFWNQSTPQGINPITGLATNNDPSTIAGLEGTSFNALNTPDANSFWNNAGTWEGIGQGLGAAASIGNVFLGFEQLGQAEDQLAFTKEAFWANYNQQVADREEAARRRAIASTGEAPNS